MIDEWTIKENFILACCVARNGDQNWVSVSRNMKLITEACGEARSKHPDFFAQKNCAQRYNQFLGTALTSKRKSRSCVDSTSIETPAEQVYRKLTFANIEELNDTIQRERERFMKLKNDMSRIQDGEMDEKIFDMWNSIQSGEAVPLENLIPDEHPQRKKESVDNLKTISSRSEIISCNASPSSCNTASRPQRQTKETEKFKSYIEQRQKHNAKYHHQPSTTTTIASPVTPMTAVKMAQSPVTTSHILPVITTQMTFTDSVTCTTTMSGFLSSMKSTPLQMQRVISKIESSSSSKHPHSPGLLILKTDTQYSSTLMSPTTTVRNGSDSRDAPVVPSSFLSSLLTSPTTDIKAQVSKITEDLKEPAEKRPDSHHVTDEAYKAYRKAQPANPIMSTCKREAPALAKLLDVVSSSNKNSTQIVPDSITSKPISSPIKSVSTQLTTNQTFSPEVLQSMLKDETKAIIPPMSLYKETKKAMGENKTTTISSIEKTTKQAIKTTNANENNTVLKLPPLKVEVSYELPSNNVRNAKENKEQLAHRLASNTITLVEDKKEGKNDSTKSHKIRENVEATVPLTFDVEEEKGNDDKEVESEPPSKKQVIDVAEINTDVAEVVATPAKQFKGKKKGRQSRGGRKKTLSGSIKIDLLEDPEKSDLEIDACGDLENDELFERRIKAPLTPSMCSSPASPALSTGSNYDPDQAQQQRAWRKSIMLVWKAAASHKYANVFLHSVTDEEAPGYSSIIFRPMDLSLIKKNIETGMITTTTEFQRDIMLMFQNALMYNRKEHDVYRMAQEMRDDVMEQIQSFISTQLMLQTSGDRDTKNLRTKAEAPGHTRQSSKSGVTFLSL